MKTIHHEIDLFGENVLLQIEAEVKDKGVGVGDIVIEYDNGFQYMATGDTREEIIYTLDGDRVFRSKCLG